MKVLFVATTFPIPPHAGASVALLETLKSIEDLCELHLLVPISEENSEADMARLQQIVPHTLVHFYKARGPHLAPLQKYTAAARSALSGGSYHATIWTDQNLRQATSDLTSLRHFDIVHCEWLYPAVSLRTLNLPLVVRTLDLHAALMNEGLEHVSQNMSALRKTFWKVETERFRQFELNVLNHTLLTIAVSSEDEAMLRREGLANVVVIPPPMTLPERTNSASHNGSCVALFLCALHLDINREAAFIFMDEIWPKLSEQVRSRVQVIFAGGRPADELRRKAEECGVQVQAPLPDEQARILYDNCDIFLSPVTTGTGIKTKALEAMANAKPMVGFPNSFRGIHLESGKHALVANSNDEFAVMFEQLVWDSALRKQVGEAARGFIHSHFNPQTLGHQLLDTYASVSGFGQRRAAAGQRH